MKEKIFERKQDLTYALCKETLRRVCLSTKCELPVARFLYLVRLQQPTLSEPIVSFLFGSVFLFFAFRHLRVKEKKNEQSKSKRENKRQGKVKKPKGTIQYNLSSNGKEHRKKPTIRQRKQRDQKQVLIHDKQTPRTKNKPYNTSRKG